MIRIKALHVEVPHHLEKVTKLATLLHKSGPKSTVRPDEPLNNRFSGCTGVIESGQEERRELRRSE